MQACDLKLNHNLSLRQIAKIQGVSHQAIYKQIKPLLPTPATEEFKTKRADIFANAQLRLLSHIAESKLKKTGVRDLIVSAGILYDKERLERGLSTSNVDMHLEQAQYQELQRERARLITELQARGVNVDLPDNATSER